MPVVRSESDRTLVGILSKKDLDKQGATVGDIMSTPPVAARPTSTVADAAVLMLKHKVQACVTLKDALCAVAMHCIHHAYPPLPVPLCDSAGASDKP